MNPTCDLSPASRPERRRDPRRSLVGTGLVLAAVLAVTGCGQQAPQAASTGTSAADSGPGAAEQPRFSRLASGEPGPGLTCPTDERVGMVADFVEGSRGASTPEKALAGQDLADGERVLLNARGSKAWVLRADGTARAVISLADVDGWVVDGRTACAG